METANDKLSDESLAHAIWVSQYSTGVANRMIKILNDSDAELTARLLVAMDTLDAESFTVSRLESLLVSVRALNHEAVQSMHAGLSAELQELAQHEAGFQLSLFQFAIPDDVPLVGISLMPFMRQRWHSRFRGVCFLSGRITLKPTGWRAYPIPCGRGSYWAIQRNR
jgi:hypothetical protein